jgi:hypothetical protein
LVIIFVITPVLIKVLLPALKLEAIFSFPLPSPFGAEIPEKAEKAEEKRRGEGEPAEGTVKEGNEGEGEVKEV